MKIKKGNAPVSGVKVKNKNLVRDAFLGIFILAIAGVTFFTLSQALAKESYYVLNQDVPAKTQVTESMLQEVSTSKGSAPQNAISIQQVRQGTVFTSVPLSTGDILTPNTTGLNLDSTNGIPDDWVVVSFNISADNAAGGNITKGDYFDVIGINPEDGAKYIFHNLLALEVNYTQGETKVTSDGKVVPLGEQLQYVVGLPANQAPVLLHTFDKYKTVKLAIAPTSLKYEKRNLEGIDKVYVSNNSLPAVDLYNGTDNAFTPVLRDENGLPVTQDSCKEGKVKPDSLCANLESLPKAKKSNQGSTVEKAEDTPKEQTKPEDKKQDEKAKNE